MLPRRGVIAIVTTAIALVLLLSFKTPSTPALARIGSGAVAVGGPSVAPAGPVGADPSPAAVDPSGAPGGPASTPTPPPATTARSNGTITGQTVDTPYGPVQVQVTLASGKIKDVQALQLPQDRMRSAVISQYAGPILRQEALTAQSAQIDLVSGATYTSEGYAQSLQSAIDQAHG